MYRSVTFNPIVHSVIYAPTVNFYLTSITALVMVNIARTKQDRQKNFGVHVDLWNETQEKRKRKKTRVKDVFGTPDRRRKPVVVSDILLRHMLFIERLLNTRLVCARITRGRYVLTEYTCVDYYWVL